MPARPTDLPARGRPGRLLDATRPADGYRTSMAAHTAQAPTAVRIHRATGPLGTRPASSLMWWPGGGTSGGQARPSGRAGASGRGSATGCA